MLTEEQRKQNKKETSSRWRKRNRQYQKDYNKTYKDRNKDRLKIENEVWRIKNKDKIAAYALSYRIKRDYNITLEDYNKLLEEQEFKCKICYTHINILNRKLVIDHCHITGEVRGLLCNECNSGLGFFKDSNIILKNAIKYLNENRRGNL